MSRNLSISSLLDCQPLRQCGEIALVYPWIQRAIVMPSMYLSSSALCIPSPAFPKVHHADYVTDSCLTRTGLCACTCAGVVCLCQITSVAHGPRDCYSSMPRCAVALSEMRARSRTRPGGKLYFPGSFSSAVRAYAKTLTTMSLWAPRWHPVASYLGT